MICERLRSEFIRYNHHHTPAFESQVVTGLVLQGPYVSHHDGVIMDSFKTLTASQPFQCLNISIMNGFAWFRFESIMYYHHHTLAFEFGAVTFTADKGPTFHTKMEYFWIDLEIEQYLNHSNVSLLVYWMIGKDWDWVGGSNVITSSCFGSWYVLKLALPVFHFSHQDWVTWTNSGNQHHPNHSNVSL